MPMCPVPHEERRLGLDATWYDELSEKEFLEALALILLVALAIAFEQVWHCILHRTEHSYRFGDVHVLGAEAGDHGLSHRRGEHHHLAKELVARAGAEFMTLGFLALVIFTFKQLGGFKMMLQRFPAHMFSVPDTEEGWLYLFKFVDMQLFIGMCLYFIVAAFVTKASLAQMRKWEEMELRFSRRRTWALENMQQLAQEDCEMWLYLRWRSYLLQKLVTWQRTRPGLFRYLCRHLSIPEDATAADNFSRLFQEHFVFSEYLAWNLEADIKDAIEIHPSTWFFMMVLERRAQTERCLSSQMPPTLHLHTATSSLAVAAAADRKHFYERHSFNSFVFQLLQMVLFLISYTFAAHLLAFDAWKEEFELRLLAVSLLVLLFCIFIFVLPLVLPIFLGTMALPPFMDDRKLEVFLAVFPHQRSSESEWRTQPALARDASSVVARSLSAREGAVRQELLERGYRVPEGASWGLLSEMFRLVVSAEGRDEERSPMFSPIRENSPGELPCGSPGSALTAEAQSARRGASRRPSIEQPAEAPLSGCDGVVLATAGDETGILGRAPSFSGIHALLPEQQGGRVSANAEIETGSAEEVDVVVAETRRTLAWSVSL